jgi:hypothetical protein
MTCEGRNLPRQLIARKLTSSIAAQAFVAVSRVGERQPARKLTNTRINGHIHMDGLICQYRERLRCGADMPTPAVLDIQNVISRRERRAVIAISVSRYTHNFFLAVRAQDDQQILARSIFKLS